MIIVVIIFSLIYVILLTLILMSYYKNNHDLEIRVLQLEKRIVNLENCKKHDECIDKLIQDLEENEKKWENYMNWVNVPDYVSIDKKGIKINRKDGEREMACKKGRGGRKK